MKRVTWMAENKKRYGLVTESLGKRNSSLHNIILNSFRILFVLWSLLVQTELSTSYVIIVQKNLILYGWGYYFPRTLSANLHY